MAPLLLEAETTTLDRMPDLIQTKSVVLGYGVKMVLAPAKAARSLVCPYGLAHLEYLTGIGLKQTGELTAEDPLA